MMKYEGYQQTNNKHPFMALIRTTRMSQYQTSKIILDFNAARNDGVLRR